MRLQFARLFTLLAALVLLPGCSDSGSSPSDAAAVQEDLSVIMAPDTPSQTLTLSDQAAVAVAAGFAPDETVELRLARMTPYAAGPLPSGSVSSLYRLSVAHDRRLTGGLSLALPVQAARLPAGWQPSDLSVLMQDEAGQWVTAGRFRYYDAAAGLAYVDLEAGRLAAAAADGAPVAALGNRISTRYLIVAVRDRSATVATLKTVVIAGSKFRIHYTSANSASPADVVPADALWNAKKGEATGANTDPDIPDYIEDLNLALNQAYSRLLTVQDADGTPLFKPLPLPIDVTVADVGDASGDSPLGGPARYTSQLAKIENWADLRVVAAHELVHVFQGQYYTNGKAGNLLTFLSGNIWFIEATADHYAPWAASLTEAERYTYFSKQGAKDYPSLGLNRAVDSSMYAAAHFLDWLEVKYPGVVGSAIRQGGNLDALTEQMATRGGLDKAWLAYGRELVSQPENGRNLNLFIVGQMHDHATGFLMAEVKAPLFNDRTTYLEWRKPMPSLGMAYLEFSTRNPNDGLLVVDTSLTPSALIHSVTYDFTAKNNGAYANIQALDYKSFMFGGQLREIWRNPVTAHPMTIPHFGQGFAKTALQMLLMNPSADTSQAVVRYWTLVPPTVSGVSNGATSWLTAELGNIPRDLIKGYNVFRTRNSLTKSSHDDFTRKLNDEVVPLPANAVSMIYNHSDLQAGDSVVAQVVDAFDHIWPPSPKRIGCELSVYRSGTPVDVYGSPAQNVRTNFTWGPAYNAESTRNFSFTMNANRDQVTDFSATEYVYSPNLALYGMCGEACYFSKKWSLSGHDLPRRPDLETAQYPLVFVEEGPAVCSRIQEHTHIYRDTAWQTMNYIKDWTCDADSQLKIMCGEGAFP